MLAGFTKTGRPSSCGELPGQPGRDLVFGERPVPGLRDAGGRQDLLGHRLVHRHGRAEHAAADVRRRWPGRACPARCRPRRVGPCSSGSTTVISSVSAAAAASIGVGDTSVPEGSRRPGIACGPSISAATASCASAHWPSVEMPTGVIRYRSGSAARSTWAAVVQRHVVLGRLAHRTAPRGGSAQLPSRNGTRPLVADRGAVPFGVRENPGQSRGSCRGRWPPDRARRRVRRRLVRLPVDPTRPAVRADRRRTQRSRVHRRARGPPGHRSTSRTSPTRSAATARRSRSPTPDRHCSRSPDGRGVGLAAQVVGVTGSVGKTSTKDLMAAACGAGRRTTANERSFNNDQGLPVTILNAPDDTEVLILEMGMRGFGQISRLCEVARPDIGVVTVVGDAHTELVGGIEGVARAKGELVEALPASGTAVLNADDPRVAAMADRTGASVVTFGSAGDVRVGGIQLDDLARATFTVASPWGSAVVRLGVPGAHMVTNAAAALAVAGVVGVDLGAAIEALAHATVSGMRMELSTAPSGATIVNDAYNANPTSMRAALESAGGDAGRPPGGGARPDGGDRGPGSGPPRDRRVRQIARDRADRRRDRSVRDRAARRSRGRRCRHRSDRRRRMSCSSRRAARPASNGSSPR